MIASVEIHTGVEESGPLSRGAAVSGGDTESEGVWRKAILRTVHLGRKKGRTVFLQLLSSDGGQLRLGLSVHLGEHLLGKSYSRDG